MIILIVCVVVWVSRVEMLSHVVKLGGLNVNLFNDLCNMIWYDNLNRNMDT